MASYVRQKAPSWFTVVAVLLVLWGLAGCASLYAHVSMGPASATDWDRTYYANLPGWFVFIYAAAVFGGLFGSIALLMRSKLARPLFVISLVAVIVQFGWVFAATGLIAHKGAVATLPFPLFIAVVAAFQIWLAGVAERRGWIS